MAIKKKAKPTGQVRRGKDNLPHPGEVSSCTEGVLPTTSDETEIVPVVREEVVIDKRRVELGRVRVHKEVTTRDQTVAEPVFTDGVEIDRVTVNRPLDAPATVRTEGDLTIVPVMEEVLVIEKRLMLREEIHIRRRRTESVHSEKVALREERVSVERVASRD